MIKVFIKSRVPFDLIVCREKILFYYFHRIKSYLDAVVKYWFHTTPRTRVTTPPFGTRDSLTLDIAIAFYLITDFFFYFLYFSLYAILGRGTRGRGQG